VNFLNVWQNYVNGNNQNFTNLSKKSAVFAQNIGQKMSNSVDGLKDMLQTSVNSVVKEDGQVRNLQSAFNGFSSQFSTNLDNLGVQFNMLKKELK